MRGISDKKLYKERESKIKNDIKDRVRGAHGRLESLECKDSTLIITGVVNASSKDMHFTGEQLDKFAFEAYCSSANVFRGIFKSGIVVVKTKNGDKFRETKIKESDCPR